MNIKPLFSALALSALVATATSANAAEIDLSFTNLTQGIYYTPLLATAHAYGFHNYELGEAASLQLQMMAEGGDTSGLETLATDAGALIAANIAGGLSAPGTTANLDAWDIGDMTHLSLAGMLLPTNDGFVGLDSWKIPSEAGSYTLYLSAYDAGTEANDEIINGMGMSGDGGIPFDPGAMNSTGATGVAATEGNTNIHVHRGNVGDTDGDGGISDLDSRVHRWLNPVAKLVVTVK